jgi:hypothetical protein
MFVAMLFISSCMINQRYHFSGISVHPKGQFALGNSVRKQKVENIQEKGGNFIKKNKAKIPMLMEPEAITKNVTFVNANLDCFNKISNETNSWVVKKCTKNCWGWGMPSTQNIKPTQSNIHQSITNIVLSEKANLMKFDNLEDRKLLLKQASYIDLADPEFWALLFFGLGFLAGLISFFTPIKFWIWLAFLFLLIGIGCTALCEGDFYYASTKILAFIGALVLVVWGGASARIFDL